MAKKPKTPLKQPNSNEGSNSATIFKTLFGEIPEQSSNSISLFSDNNPFRRKPESEIKIQANKADHDVAVIAHSDSPQLKRKKEKLQKQASDIVEETKKLKRGELEGNEEIDSNVGNEKKKEKKKKRKRDEVEAEYEAKRYGVPKQMEEVKEESAVVLGEKRKKMDNPEDMMVSEEGFDDESKLLRTVFVGNLPLKIKKKELLKEFGVFGDIESVRIRSVPIADGKIPRKGAIIRKRINENGDSVHAYIVFKTEESAQASLSHNLAVVGGKHIRVDRACPPRKKLKGDASPLYDNKRTVFVGNLPFDVKDEEVYQLFSGIKNLETSIEAVRVIRDPGSSLGKGIAYVLFKTMDAAKSVVTKRYLKLRNRELRLSHAKSDSTPSKRKDTSSPGPNNYPSKKFAVDPRTPDTNNKMKDKSNLSYQGLRASKSGSQKKVHTKFSAPAKSKPQTSTPTGQSSSKKKRPAVAARKERALKSASSSKVVGTKRKFGNRTPESGGQKKKAKKFK